MGRLFGDFWKQYLAATLLAVVFGAALAAFVAGWMDGAFERLLGDVLGPEEDATLIVHVRAESARDAAERIGDVLTELEGAVPPSADGARLQVRQGVTVAGNANFFVVIPQSLVVTDFLQRIPRHMQELPGYNGHTWLLEPSVTVVTVDGGVRDAAARRAAELEGVRAVVRHGQRVTVVAENDGARDSVARDMEQWLAAGRIVELVWPEDKSLFTYARTMAALEEGLPKDAWRPLEGDGAEGDDPWRDAAVALASLPEAWERWTVAGASAEAGVRQMLALMDALEPLLLAVEGPDVQAERLAGALRGSDPDAMKNVVVQLAVSALWQSVAGEAGLQAKAAPAPGEGSAAPALLIQRWEAARSALEAAAEGAARLADLSDGDRDAVSEALALLEDVLPGAGQGKAGLTLLVEDDAAAAAVDRIVADAFGDGDASPVQSFVGSPGAVEPNPRALLTGLLKDVRRAIAGVLSLLVAGAVLVVDHAVVFSAAPGLGALGKSSRAVAGIVGGLLFAGTYGLAGGGMPLGCGLFASYAGELLVVAGLGGAAGLLVRRLAPRISPVDEAELLAGRSVGLDDGQLLQEIVVPRGRPGLLTFLNSFRQQFP